MLVTHQPPTDTQDRLLKLAGVRKVTLGPQAEREIISRGECQGIVGAVYALGGFWGVLL